MLKRNQDTQLLVPPTGLPEDFQPTPASGLTSEQAHALEKAGKGNKTRDASLKPLWKIFFSNLFTLFNLLNIALALCLVAVHSYRNMMFLGVVISNTLIGTIQEVRARNTVRKLRLLNPSQIRTLRDGQETLLPPDRLVEGDLVILSRGSQVPADAVVLDGHGAVDESMLTGESLPISKKNGDLVMSGTFVTEGEIRVQLLYVGHESYVNRLTREARKINPPKSALMQDLNKLTRIFSMILVPLGGLLFVSQHYLSHLPLEKAVPQSVAAMVGMIPEGLILLTSVALAVGVVRLGRKGALVQELYGIETLSRADILCLDKTGTLTTGKMQLADMVPMETDKVGLNTAAARILSAFPEDDTSTFQALRASVSPSSEHPDAVLPFSSDRKCSCAVFGKSSLIFGAPSFVMRQGYDRIREKVETWSDQGYRVLLLAEGGPANLPELPEVKRVLGLVLLQDQVREAAEQTLAYFREEDVQVKIISGDDPHTVAAIARRLNLPGADRFLDTSGLTDGQLREAAVNYTVFGRVTPHQKKELVLALQQAGHSIAMTGDGVNDIPALKAADCSIAMAGGADAARNVAQLTLLTSDFSLLPDIVLEGRRVVNNITRSASLFLIKTLYSFLLTLLLIFLPATYPFQPVQLTVISSFTIGIPAFFLSLEKNRERIRGHFLKTILRNAMPGGICVTLCACLCMLMENFGWSVELGSTMATICAGGIGLMALLQVAWPLNLYRGLLIACMAGCMSVVFLFFGKLIFFTPLDSVHALIFVGLMVFSFIMMQLLIRLLYRHFPVE